MKNSDLSIPEYTLCKMLKDTLTEEEVSEINNISSDNWDSIYKIFQNNRLLPLLYHKIKSYFFHAFVCV